MTLAIFLYMYIVYVYNEIFTPKNGIFTCLGWVDVDFFYLWAVNMGTMISKNDILLWYNACQLTSQIHMF